MKFTSITRIAAALAAIAGSAIAAPHPTGHDLFNQHHNPPPHQSHPQQLQQAHPQHGDPRAWRQQGHQPALVNHLQQPQAFQQPLQQPHQQQGDPRTHQQSQAFHQEQRQAPPAAPSPRDHGSVQQQHPKAYPPSHPPTDHLPQQPQDLQSQQPHQQPPQQPQASRRRKVNKIRLRRSQEQTANAIEGALAANRLATADIETAIKHLGETKKLAAMKTERRKRVTKHLEELQQLPGMDVYKRGKAKERAARTLQQAMKASDSAWKILEHAKPEIKDDPIQGRYPSMYPDGSLVDVLDGLALPPAQ